MLITQSYEENDRILFIFLIRKGVALIFWQPEGVRLLLAFPAAFNGSSWNRLKPPLFASPRWKWVTLEEAGNYTDCLTTWTWVDSGLNWQAGLCNVVRFGKSMAGNSGTVISLASATKADRNHGSETFSKYSPFLPTYITPFHENCILTLIWTQCGK